MAQPIIRGIQAVGAVDIKYGYNGNGGVMKLPTDVMKLGALASAEINTTGGVNVSGFRLDSEFLRAVQQIASSVQIPILGGGAVALTNNNRSGTLSINCTKTSTPSPVEAQGAGNKIGGMYKPTGGAAIGPLTDAPTFDLVFLAQVQQAQPGGDSEGATIKVIFDFCGLTTTISFEGCTVAGVDPIGLAGNDAVNYNVSFNYLNWTTEISKSKGQIGNDLTTFVAGSASAGGTGGNG